MKEIKAPEQIFFISFNHDTCVRIKRELPPYQVAHISRYRNPLNADKPTPTIEQLIADARAGKLDALDLDGNDGIVDVFKPALAKLQRRPEVCYEHKRFADKDGGEVIVEAQSRYSEIDQVLHFDLHYRKHSELIRRKSVNMRCFFPAELRYFIERAGLEIVHAFGDYDEAPLVDSSPKQILICRRTA